MTKSKNKRKIKRIDLRCLLKSINANILALHLGFQELNEMLGLVFMQHDLSEGTTPKVSKNLKTTKIKMDYIG